MKALMVRPMKKPEVIEIENTLDVLQHAVDGWIEVVQGDNHTVIVLDEEGKLKGKPMNREFNGDILVGDFLVCGENGDGDFVDLNDDQIRRWTRMFWDVPPFLSFRPATPPGWMTGIVEHREEDEE